jgi:hypothetical protein
MIKLMLGDCLQILRDIPADSVDAVVTDPPAGIRFMRKAWDHDKGSRDAWIDWLQDRLAECLRVAKPGSRVLVWAIPRTSHWTGMAVEDAGWIIEDRVSHLFGQGFPKAKSKLKPACEDWWLARKPSKNVPPLNIDDCRIAHVDPVVFTNRKSDKFSGNAYNGGDQGHYRAGDDLASAHPSGRWPANLVLDEEAAAMLDEQSGIFVSGKAPDTGFVRNSDKHRNAYGSFEGNREEPTVLIGDSGGASRFFYCAKASPKDRGEGNDHPTVKPHDLMRWLIRLITNPGDVVLDPFMGSGSTGKAATAEGRSFIGIEKEEPYLQIAKRRIDELGCDLPLFPSLSH